MVVRASLHQIVEPESLAAQMAPRPDLVATDDTVPRRAAVVVIGGGIIGTSTAFALAEKGIDVVLCEKGEIGAEQSSRNLGWCRTQGRDPREIALSLEAMRIWRGFNGKIEGDTGFRAEGVLYLCNSESDVAKYEAWLEQAKVYQVDARLDFGRRGRQAVAWRHAQMDRRACIRLVPDGQNRRRRRRRSQRVPDGSARRSSPIARSAASRLRPAGSVASSPSGDASRATASCSPVAPGLACSAATTTSTSRNSRYAAR